MELQANPAGSLLVTWYHTHVVRPVRAPSSAYYSGNRGLESETKRAQSMCNNRKTNQQTCRDIHRPADILPPPFLRLVETPRDGSPSGADPVIVQLLHRRLYPRLILEN